MAVDQGFRARSECAVSGHRKRVSRVIGDTIRAVRLRAALTLAGVTGPSCHHRCRRRGPSSADVARDYSVVQGLGLQARRPLSARG